MTSSHVRSLLVVLPLVLAAGARAGQEGRELLAEEAAELVADYLGAKPKKAAEARALLLATRAEDRRTLFDALEAGRPPRNEPPRSRREVLTIATPEAEPFDGFLIVTPQIPSRNRNAWNQDGAQELVDRLYRKAIAEYAFDVDRVYLSGFGTGSGGAMRFAEYWPHRFAGFHCVGRLWHALDDEPEWFLRERVRVRYPKKICAVYHDYDGEGEEAVGRRRVYWLEATAHGWFAPASGVVDGQTITVDAPRVKRGFVLVNDRLVDLDLPVKLVVNGATVFEGPVERSVEHLLATWEADRDPGCLYWNRIEFGP